MKNIFLVMICMILSGCVTSTAVGSKNWHNERLNELREARFNGYISTEKYLDLKNEADKIRQEYVIDSRFYTYPHTHHHYRQRFGYGFGYHHGFHGKCRH